MSEPSISMSANYTVSFDKASCCPYLLLLTNTAAQAFHNKTCVRNKNQSRYCFNKQKHLANTLLVFIKLSELYL